MNNVNNNFISHEGMKGGAARIVLDLPYRNSIKHFKAAFYTPDVFANPSSPSINNRVKNFSLGILLFIPIINIVVELALRIFSAKPAVQPVVVQIYGSSTSTTYHPEHSTLEQDADGIIDFARVLPDNGVAYIADGSGHGKPATRKILEPIWNQFDQEFINDYKTVLDNFENSTQIMEFIKKHFMILNGKFERAGTASTFSLAILIERNGKKYLASGHVGDSTLVHVTRDGNINYVKRDEKIKGSEGFETNQSELSTVDPNKIKVDFREVQTGDKIYGLTDGITDFLADEVLHGILIDVTTNGNNLLPRLANEIMHQEASKSKKIYEERVKNSSDDISAFVMGV